MNKFSKKINSFDWRTMEVDGHNHKQIKRALSLRTKDKPIAIIANTIKGKGGFFLENDNKWHHQNLTFENYDAIIKRLGF